MKANIGQEAVGVIKIRGSEEKNSCNTLSNSTKLINNFD